MPPHKHRPWASVVPAMKRPPSRTAKRLARLPTSHYLTGQGRVDFRYAAIRAVRNARLTAAKDAPSRASVPIKERPAVHAGQRPTARPPLPVADPFAAQRLRASRQLDVRYRTDFGCPCRTSTSCRCSSTDRRAGHAQVRPPSGCWLRSGVVGRGFRWHVALLRGPWRPGRWVRDRGVDVVTLGSQRPQRTPQSPTAW